MSVSENKSLLDRFMGYFNTPQPALKKTSTVANKDAFGLEFQTRGNYYGHPRMRPDILETKTAALNATYAAAEGKVFQPKPWKSIEANLTDDDIVQEYIALKKRSLPYQRYELPSWYKHGTSIYQIDEKQGGPQRNPQVIP